MNKVTKYNYSIESKDDLLALNSNLEDSLFINGNSPCSIDAKVFLQFHEMQKEPNRDTHPFIWEWFSLLSNYNIEIIKAWKSSKAFEVHLDAECPYTHTKVKVEEIDKVEVIDFTSEGSKKLIYLVGGIHGDEMQGIKANLLLRKFLESNCTLSKAFLVNCNFKLIPILNSVGYKAGLRFAPRHNQVVSLMERGKIFVEENEVFDVNDFTMKVKRTNPVGWQDPNREWDNNHTIVKDHIVSILNDKPDLILFHHDWADPKGMVQFYTNKKLNIKEGVDRAFFRYAPQSILNAFKTKDVKEGYCFFSDVNDKESIPILGHQLLRLFNQDNIVIETFSYNQESYLLQFSVCLYVLIKLINLEMEEDEIEREIETQLEIARNISL